MASFVRPPCRKFPFLFPSGAPPPAPCIRQTRKPFTAGARQRLPSSRVVGALHPVDGHFVLVPPPAKTGWAPSKTAIGSLAGEGSPARPAELPVTTLSVTKVWSALTVTCFTKTQNTFPSELKRNDAINWSLNLLKPGRPPAQGLQLWFAGDCKQRDFEVISFEYDPVHILCSRYRVV
jgi:hypothetical protein